jgi:hypothetical protein
MNILYFDDRELWSPSIADMLEEEDATETVSVSNKQKMQGRQIGFTVANVDHPTEKLAIHIGEE